MFADVMEFGSNDMKNTRWIMRLVFPLLTLLLAPWLAGCQSAKENTLTGKLWQSAASSNYRHREPAPDPKLAVFQTKDRKDVLVQYDEWGGRSDAVEHRAFLLRPNQKDLAAGRRPVFLDEKKAAKIQSSAERINSENGTGIKDSEELQAMVAPSGRSFTLKSKGAEIGSYDLPVYLTTTSRMAKLARANTFTRLVALPAAAMGDAAFYGGEFCYLVGITQGPYIAYVVLNAASHCHK